MHRAAGARFCALTDHDRVTDLTAARARWPDMVLLEGFEWSRSENLLFIGESVPPLYAFPLREAMRRADGLLTVVCHPRPSLSSDYWTVDMIMELRPPPLGIEVYNAHYGRPHLVFRDPNPLYTDTWDEVLSRGLRVWGFVNDDSHDPPDFGRTRTMACVDDVSAGSLMAAIRAGRFYGSTGLLMEEVSVKAETIRVVLGSPARGRFIGPGGVVLRETEGKDFSYRSLGETYVRFEAEAKGCRIFLQPFYLE